MLYSFVCLFFFFFTCAFSVAMVPSKEFKVGSFISVSNEFLSCWISFALHYTAKDNAFLVRLIIFNFFSQLVEFSNLMNSLDPKDPLSLKVRNFVILAVNHQSCCHNKINRYFCSKSFSWERRFDRKYRSIRAYISKEFPI